MKIKMFFFIFKERMMDVLINETRALSVGLHIRSTYLVLKRKLNERKDTRTLNPLVLLLLLSQ